MTEESGELTANVSCSQLVKMVLASGKHAVAGVMSIDSNASQSIKLELQELLPRLAAWCASEGIPACFVAQDALLVIVESKLSMRLRREFGDIEHILNEQIADSTKAFFFHLPGEAQAMQRHLGANTRLLPYRSKDQKLGVELDILIKLYKSMTATDIGNFLREKPIFKFNATDVGVLLSTELVTDIADLSSAIGLSLEDRPWVLNHLTRKIDDRIVSHLIHDAAHRNDGYGINLHIDSVLSPGFSRKAQLLNRELHGKLGVDLDYQEWEMRAEDFEKASRILRDNQFSVSLDNVPASKVNTFVIPDWIDGYIKVDWRFDFDSDFAKHCIDLAKAVEGWHPDRVVLLHCRSFEIISAALTAGLTLLEGFEVSSYIEAQKPSAIKAEDKKRLLPEVESNVKKKGLLARLLGNSS